MLRQITRVGDSEGRGEGEAEGVGGRLEKNARWDRSSEVVQRRQGVNRADCKR